MEKELQKELEARSTAEVTNGVVTQITQAIDEGEDEVEMLVFGELRTQGIIPIEEACAKCTRGYFDTIAECQEHQGKDAKARGFNKVICPCQFS